MKWIGTGILFVLFDFGFASWYNHQNEKNLIHAFEHGSCPEPDVKRDRLIYREEVIKRLRRILEPISDHSSYHVVVGTTELGRPQWSGSVLGMLEKGLCMLMSPLYWIASLIILQRLFDS